MALRIEGGVRATDRVDHQRNVEDYLKHRLHTDVLIECDFQGVGNVEHKENAKDDVEAKQ